ncbi:MAG: DUF4034 domain-containing protein, partial [Verrucomicrobiaceae bacterium]
MRFISRHLSTALIVPVILSAVSCNKKAIEGKRAEAAANEVAAANQLTFRNDARQLYNNRDFAGLEALAKKIRENKSRFVDGQWAIEDFYSSQDCRKDEPESMWQLHDQIHRDWLKKYPDSITARVAHANFLITYAWHARSDRRGSQVTQVGWDLFRERLAEARTVLDKSKELKPVCPMMYSSYQTIALGQGWPRAEYDALFKEAKSLE